MKSSRFAIRGSWFVALAAVLLAGGAGAVTVTENETRFAARAWVASGRALGSRVGTRVDTVRTYAVTNGYSFRAVKMSNGGTLFMTSDTDLTPVIAFTSAEDVSLAPGTPLYDLLVHDIVARARLKELQPTSGTSAQSGASTLSASSNPVTSGAGSNASLWANLIARGESLASPLTSASAKPMENVDDVRVSPLLTTKWSQDGIFVSSNSHLVSVACYNYYTPPFDAGAVTNYPCGCGATAMAQVMRKFAFPTDPIDTTKLYKCTVDEVEKDLPMVASEETGGFDWARMVDNPKTLDFGADNYEESVKSVQAIGALTFDCGLALAMSYSSGAGSALPGVAALAYRDFGYASAFAYWDGTSYRSGVGGLHNLSLRERVVYANLDAGRPVEFMIYGYGKVDGKINYSDWSGHMVVADGYGYKKISGEDTAYVHINLGWSGSDDAWYNIPEIDCSSASSTIGGSPVDYLYLGGAVFNISTNDTGAILSGRIVDADGAGVEGATVNVWDLEMNLVAMTNANACGVYAFTLPGGCSYYITAEDETTGRLGDLPDPVLLENTVADESFVVSSASDVGNSWGNDIVLREPNVRVILPTPDPSVLVTNDYASLDSALRGVRVARLDDARVEILSETELRRSAVLTNNCAIVPADGCAYAWVTRELLSTKTHASLSLISSALVSFDGILFEHAAETPVKVTGGSIALFSGRTAVKETLSVETADTNGFCLAGAIAGGLSVTLCSALEEDATFGWASCGYETATNNAAKILHPTNPELGGFAYTNESGLVFLKWARVPVDPDAAVTSLQTESAARQYFRDVDRALRGAVDGGTVVVSKSGRMTESLTLAGEVLLTSENGAELRARMPVTLAVSSGADLTLTNIVIDGSSADGTNAFLAVAGRARLRSGAKLSGFTIVNPHYGYGAIYIQPNGCLEMDSGAVIEGCKATTSITSTESGAYGGGVYLNKSATFEMRGGTIRNCFAENFGGGVYAAKNAAAVRLSGDAVISGNTRAVEGGTAMDDLYVCKGVSFRLAGLLEGSVGVRHSDAALNESGAAFITADDGVSPEDLEDSADSFFNNADPSDTVEVEERSLVWRAVEVPTGPMPLDEDDTNVVARTVYADGVTNWWGSVSDAFLSLTNNAAVEMLTNANITANITVPAFDITLTSAPECNVTIGRTQNAAFVVNSGAVLDVRNLTLNGAGCLFDVNGGILTLEQAKISAVTGSLDRASSAVKVYNGGTFEMGDGSAILLCQNTFADANDNSGAAGGIVAEGEGTVVRLSGTARISDCGAQKAGGVFIGNKAVLRVSGAASVENNVASSGETVNVLRADTAAIVLEDALTGSIGVSSGIGADTNVFGTVAAGPSASVAICASATNFHNDVTAAWGVVATNETEAILVWSDALDETGAYQTEDGTLFHAVETAPAPGPTPVSVDPIAFKSIARVSDVEWALVLTNRVRSCGYRLLWTEDLSKGFTATGAWETAEADGEWTTNILFAAPAPAAIFWKAEGKDGEQPAE